MNVTRNLKAHTILADLSDRFHDEFGMWLAWGAMVEPWIDFKIWLNWVTPVSETVSQLVEDNHSHLSWNDRGYIDCNFMLCESIQPDMLLVLPKNHPLVDVSYIPKIAKKSKRFTELGTFVWLYETDLTEEENEMLKAPIPIAVSQYYLETQAALMTRSSVASLNEGK